ncbi:MAG: transcriptional regulator [Dactylosporangium sp.]|jgi:hypothetical protein|nr:transcriptional regulator [Dactylosporangium sp.]
MNERLRTAMLRRGVGPHELAASCGVDPKTVERWIRLGRVPYRRHRWATAHRLDVDETYLWPEVLSAGSGRREEVGAGELVAVYPDRASVPGETLLRLLTGTQERLDVLVCSGTFFARKQPRVTAMLAVRMRAGVQVRLCIGNPTGGSVAFRDREEGLAGTLAAKIRASLAYYCELAGQDGCEIRLHDTTLYASMFRYDDQILINPHLYGQPASLNPTFHFRRLDGGSLFDHYLGSFERVWETAVPWLGTVS